MLILREFTRTKTIPDSSSFPHPRVHSQTCAPCAAAGDHTRPRVFRAAPTLPGGRNQNTATN